MSSPFFYIPRPLGDEPDLTRPLRSEPVRRFEVRIYRRLGVWRITMPVGTYRLEERGNYHSQHFVGDPALWQPLMDELTIQHAVHDKDWRRFGLPTSGSIPLPKPEISWGVEYACTQCGARFLAHKLAGNKVALCSDKCVRERIVAQRRQRRETAGAEVRASRICEHCGGAIEARRPTKRFCSDRCRNRALHQRRKKAAHRSPCSSSMSPTRNSPR